MSVFLLYKKNFLYSDVVLLVYCWEQSEKSEVRLFVTDSTEHSFDMYNCLLKSVNEF